MFPGSGLPLKSTVYNIRKEPFKEKESNSPGPCGFLRMRFTGEVREHPTCWSPAVWGEEVAEPLAWCGWTQLP